MRWIGLFSLLGHPLFGWIWTVWLPQPWESPLLRGIVGSLAVPMVLGLGMADVNSRQTRVVFSLICWVQLPLFFSWMYLANGGNTVWLASVVAMILIYYHATDWRLATFGVLFGGLTAWMMFGWFGPPEPALSPTQLMTNSVVIAFAWASALTLGFSAANLRREHLRNTLATVGIMAHELRTPLATIALVGDVMDNESRHLPPAQAEQMEKLAVRVQTLVRAMHHQIDAQIANARLLNLPAHREPVSAASAVQEAIAHYPFRTARERAAVQVLVRRDFRFHASPQLFSQVIDNLLKNALKSLAAQPVPMRPGDITVEVGVLHNRGRVVITDQGAGVPGHLAPRIFEPFFSTDTGSGHGLGLAFCRRVIGSLGGTIQLRPGGGRGASFIIELPLLS
ncbi:MAG: HAMP domain-containing histidine kinase [Burkholderiales bacterium]|nr:HAMP domain-containing histidine kinase [Burkholderiales bacterium]